MSDGYYQQACAIVQAEENARLYALQDVDLAAKAAEAAGAEVEFVDVAQPNTACIGESCERVAPPAVSLTDEGQPETAVLSENETDNTTEAL